MFFCCLKFGLILKRPKSGQSIELHMHSWKAPKTTNKRGCPCKSIDRNWPQKGYYDEQNESFGYSLLSFNTYVGEGEEQCKPITFLILNTHPTNKERNIEIYEWHTIKVSIL